MSAAVQMKQETPEHDSANLRVRAQSYTEIPLVQQSLCRRGGMCPSAKAASKSLTPEVSETVARRGW